MGWVHLLICRRQIKMMTAYIKLYTKQLKENIYAWGGDLAGIAEVTPLKPLKLDPPDLLDPFCSAVSIAVHIPIAVFGEIKDGPTMIYDHAYQIANRTLDDIAFKTAKYLENDGFYSLPIPSSQLTDEKSWYGAISHKAVARMAGLGWQGKNLLLITPEYGSSVRLITILTQAPLATDSPIKNRCGKCNKCVESCPAGAIKGINTKDHYKTRNEAMFFEKCVSQLKKHSGMLESYPLKDTASKHKHRYHKMLCGLCIKACPFSNKGRC